MAMEPGTAEASAAVTPRLYMVGNAHIDPVWLWRWTEGCAEAIGTCWAAVDLLERRPGVVFTRGDVVVYRWIEELEPALFERIRSLVRAGRWVIVNAWIVQPDCNLPCGEAFIRQALYGKRYIHARFGVDVTVGYNVDSFGHAATLPMLLRHTGYDSYVFMRPEAREKDLPAPLFTWAAPDGSRVATFRLHPYYNQSPPLVEKLPAVEALAARAGYPLMCFFGVGNHGGGPTLADVALIEEQRANGHDLVFGDPVRYFRDVAGVPRPTVRDELQYHSIGCYAVVAAIKRLNRRAEAALAQAEGAAALATRHAHAAYPAERLRALWETLLFNQFHDILAGTSLESAMRDAVEALSGVVQGAEEILNAAIRRLAATIAPAADPTDATFVVFNLTGTRRRTPLEYEPWTDLLGGGTRRLRDDAGGEVPYQALATEGANTWRGRPRLLFVADVPAFGYRVYRYAHADTAAATAAPAVVATERGLESATWRLELDPATGGIARLVDKRAGRDVFAGVGHRPIVIDDPSDTWSHGQDRFALEGQDLVCERAEVVERGAMRAGVRTRARAGTSTVTCTYLLYDDPALPLEMRIQIDWHERHKLLRLRYPLALAHPTVRYEVPYGSLERPADGREYPGQRWVLARGDDGYGLALASDAVCSYAAAGGSLFLTALRSPAYAHHDPNVLDPDGTYRYTDQGEHAFTLRLLADPGIRPRDAVALADDLTRPPIATPHVARGGLGPWQASLLAVESGSGVAAWLKAPEDGPGLVLRVLEVDGRDEAIRLPETGDAFALAPWSILTLRQTPDGHWHRSDGLEA